MIELLLALTLQASTPSVPLVCALTEADRKTNRGLSFQDFDQGGSDLPHTGWNLTMAGCHAQAVEAEADYLLHGPPLADRERVVIRWHMAQGRARLERRAEAAALALSAIQDTPPQEDGFDWNAYVRGAHGYLTGDRALLDSSLAALRAAPGQRNAINADALARLSRCFDRPYSRGDRDRRLRRRLNPSLTPRGHSVDERRRRWRDGPGRRQRVIRRSSSCA